MTKIKSVLFTTLFTAACIVASSPVNLFAQRQNVIDDAKHMVFDNRILNDMNNAHLVIGKVEKSLHNPLFGPDKLWEPQIDNMYPNILYDAEEKLYKCWYNPFIVDNVVTKATEEQKKKYNRRLLEKFVPGARHTGLCYATSKDGMTWNKPELGIVKYEGSTANNILMRHVHGCGIIKDIKDPDPKRRYKMFTKYGKPMAVSFSADGIHWDTPKQVPEIESAGDTHNNAFWDPNEKKWVGITRLWKGRVRVVGRTESKDFDNWTPAQEILRGTWHFGHTYGMIVFPYANLYLGLTMEFDRGRDVVHVELAWSPDTKEWKRICPGTPLIPRGKVGSYDWGCIFAAASPVVYDDHIRIYYGGSDAQHYDIRNGHLCMAKLGLDRWAGFCHSSEFKRTGSIGFRPVSCKHKNLAVTADVEKGGWLKVIAATPEGENLVEPIVLEENATEKVIADLSKRVGKPVWIRFEMKDATIYSFSFKE